MSDYSKLDPKIREKVAEWLPKCLERRGEHYYATEAGCIRLREILAEHGINCNVTLTDGRFEIE